MYDRIVLDLITERLPLLLLLRPLHCLRDQTGQGVHDVRHG